MIGDKEINHISSIPIGVYRNNDHGDHEYFWNLNYIHNSGVFRTESTNVLQNTFLERWIYECINDYAYTCLATTQRLKLTQSWCIKHDNVKSEIFSHYHPNSIVSGAYYIECNDQSSMLYLKSPSPMVNTQIEWDKDPKLIKEQSWLWKHYEVSPTKGNLIIFPSFLEHYVKGSSNDTRCVLSFNTWFDGNLGNKENLTLLTV